MEVILESGLDYILNPASPKDLLKKGGEMLDRLVLFVSRKNQYWVEEHGYQSADRGDIEA